MPARSNFFQDVVALVARALDPDSTVEESRILPSRTTGAPREVDVLVTGKVGGHPVTVGIEARDSKRKVTVEWVEQQLCKHEDLGTARLVLVSASGFTADAAARAEACGAVPMTPALLFDLSSPTVDLELRYATVTLLGSAAKVCTPGRQLLWVENVDALGVFNQVGAEMTDISSLCRVALTTLLDSADHDSGLWLVPAAHGHPIGYRTLVMDMTTKFLQAGQPQPAFLRFVDADGIERFAQMLELYLQVRGDVARSPISLAKRLFGGATVTYGQIPPPDLAAAGTATFVHVEGATDAAGCRRVSTVRFRPSAGHGPAQDISLHAPEDLDLVCRLLLEKKTDALASLAGVRARRPGQRSRPVQPVRRPLLACPRDPPPPRGCCPGRWYLAGRMGGVASSRDGFDYRGSLDEAS